MELSNDEKLIVNILSGDDLTAKRYLVTALIINEKKKILDQIRQKWGDEHWFEVVEDC